MDVIYKEAELTCGSRLHNSISSSCQAVISPTVLSGIGFQLQVCFAPVHSQIVVVLLEIMSKQSVPILENVVYWDVSPCGPCKIRRFGGSL
jgi:hypothetical protein